MRLSEQDILAGLEHPNVFVRDYVLEYFENARRRDVGITKRLIPVVEQYGWNEAFLWSYRFASFDLDEESLLWVLDQIERADEAGDDGNTPYHLVRMVSKAPVDVLRPHLSRILESDGVREIEESIGEFLRRRVDIWDQGPDKCWEMLHAHVEGIGEVEEFADANVPYGEMLVERIASAGGQFAPAVLAFLDEQELPDDGPKPWLVGLMIILAGHLRLDSAVPLLFRRYEDDWDWYNEEVSHALVRIGSPVVLDYISQQYPSQPWYVRNYLAGSLDSIHQDISIDCIQPLLVGEEDDFLRGQLGVALASHFDDRGVEPARRLYFEVPDDPEREPIRERLFAHACLADIDLPEKDQWAEELEQDRKEYERKRAETDPLIDSLVRRLNSEQADDAWQDDDDWDEDDPDYRAPVEPIINTAPRVGRNDPCPCGSGKKYKKCCLRQQAT